MSIFKKTVVSISSVLGGLAISSSVSFAEDFSAGVRQKSMGLRKKSNQRFLPKLLIWFVKLRGIALTIAGMALGS